MTMFRTQNSQAQFESNNKSYPESRTMTQKPAHTSLSGLESQEAILEKLVDSLDNMEKIEVVTEKVGTFLVQMRMKTSSIDQQRLFTSNNSRKRKRCSSDDDSGDASTQHRSNPAKRMLNLYCKMRKLQILLRQEIEVFTDELEEECLYTLAKAPSSTFLEAEFSAIAATSS